MTTDCGAWLPGYGAAAEAGACGRLATAPDAARLPPHFQEFRMASLFDLSGKVAIVTGGSRGIGRAICERLAEHGAKVVVSSRKADACQEVVDAITARGGTAMAVACNISRKEELRALVDATLAAWGQVDVLVCNAAVNPYFGPSQDIPDDAYDRIMNSNVRSNLWLCQMVLPGMAERGGGSADHRLLDRRLPRLAAAGHLRGEQGGDMQLARRCGGVGGQRNVR
jgi:NAD(P)-dependent dehydrogenase (short-subunit alcohol dehydrogenase family)